MLVPRKFVGSANSVYPFAGCPQRVGQRADTRGFGGTDRNGAIGGPQRHRKSSVEHVLPSPRTLRSTAIGSDNRALCWPQGVALRSSAPFGIAFGERRAVI